MSDHYYSEKPTVKSERKSITTVVRGNELTFTTDAGVFSKKEIDFGTKLMLDTLDITDISGDILDVGCGYGPIGLSLAKENSNKLVWMVDINERAIELAELNKKNNNIDNVIIKKSYLLNELGNNDFAYVISNPPIRAGKKVVHELFEHAYNRLVTNGQLWIVIQKKQGGPSAVEKLSQLFAEVDVIKKSKGYYIVRAIKR